jgi:hypothetical protein
MGFSAADKGFPFAKNCKPDKYTAQRFTCKLSEFASTFHWPHRNAASPKVASKVKLFCAIKELPNNTRKKIQCFIARNDGSC